MGVAFLCLLCACLPTLPLWSELTNNSLRKQRWGTFLYISLPSDLNAIIGITSYYCVIHKMVILHDAIKTIQNKVFAFFSKKRTKTCTFSKNEEKQIKKITKNPCELFFFLKNPFFSTLIIFQSFFVIFR